MKKGLIQILTLVALFMLLSASDQPPEKKITIAVYPVKMTGADASLGPVITSFLVTKLGKSPMLGVIEQEMNEEFERQLAYANSDKCDTKHCPIPIGEAIPAQKIMISTVAKLGKKYVMNVRVINVSKKLIDFSVEESRVCEAEELDQLVEDISYGIREKFGEKVEPEEPSPAPSPRAEPGPAPTPSAANGQLRLTTTPSGADVYLDAEKKGKTPLTLTAPAGNHLLTVTAQGYAPLTEEVNIQAYQTSSLARVWRRKSGPY